MTSDRMETGYRLGLVSWLIGLIAITALACSDGDDAAPPEVVPASPTATPTRVPTTTPTVVPTAMPPYVLPDRLRPNLTSDASVWPEVLEDSFSRMARVGSLHFVVDVEVVVESADTRMVVPVSFVGDYQAPDRVRGDLKMSLGFLDVEVETVSIGDETYFTNPETGQWEAGSLEGVPFISPPDLLEADTSAIEDLVLDRWRLDGRPVYRITGTLAAEYLGGGEVSGDLHVEYLIGIDDLLMRRVKVAGPLETGEGGIFFGGGSPDSSTLTMSMTMELSDFDEPVDIEAPQIGSSPP